MVITIVKANKYQLADSFQKTREMEQKIQVLALFDKNNKTGETFTSKDLDRKDI